MATSEVIDAFDWYEEQRIGLGVEFLDELERFYESLYQNPRIYSYYDKQVRQGKMHRFPYLVVYEVFEVNIVIYSVFMYQQDPDKKRIG